MNILPHACIHLSCISSSLLHIVHVVVRVISNFISSILSQSLRDTLKKKKNEKIKS